MPSRYILCTSVCPGNSSMALSLTAVRQGKRVPSTGIFYTSFSVGNILDGCPSRSKSAVNHRIGLSCNMARVGPTAFLFRTLQGVSQVPRKNPRKLWTRAAMTDGVLYCTQMTRESMRTYRIHSLCLVMPVRRSCSESPRVKLVTHVVLQSI